MPSSLVALAIVVIAVLPGSMYTWAYERQASAYGVTLADRTLRFLAVSAMFHVVLGWAEYAVYRAAFTGAAFRAGQFALAWAGALLVLLLPALCGTVLGGLYTTRSSRTAWPRVRALLGERAEQRLLQVALGPDPAPRAWDDLFAERPTAYLRIRTKSGDWIAGRFASHSYAGGFPHAADLLLEEAWAVFPDGTLGDAGLGYPLYVPASEIAWLEILPDEEAADDGEEG